ncbi:MAG: hypothetical protein EOP38_02580 [Rubrivivax sp.]|nr:MAG: hypothetical protein EOP38_02580 [Rubrivivax sp.]
MKIFLRMMLAAMVLALSSMAANAARTAPMFEPGRVEMQRVDGKAPTAAQVHEAILNGAKLDGGSWVWTVKSDVPGTVKLAYSRGNKFEAVIQIDYDKKGYQLKYVSSIGLRYSGAEGETREIHRNYNKWIDTLLHKIAIPGELEPVAIPSSKDKDGTDDGKEDK